MDKLLVLVILLSIGFISLQAIDYELFSIGELRDYYLLVMIEKSDSTYVPKCIEVFIPKPLKRSTVGVEKYNVLKVNDIYDLSLTEAEFREIPDFHHYMKEFRASDKVLENRIKQFYSYPDDQDNKKMGMGIAGVFLYERDGPWIPLWETDGGKITKFLLPCHFTKDIICHNSKLYYVSDREKK